MLLTPVGPVHSRKTARLVARFRELCAGQISRFIEIFKQWASSAQCCRHCTALLNIIPPLQVFRYSTAAKLGTVGLRLDDRQIHAASCKVVLDVSPFERVRKMRWKSWGTFFTLDYFLMLWILIFTMKHQILFVTISKKARFLPILSAPCTDCSRALRLFVCSCSCISPKSTQSLKKTLLSVCKPKSKQPSIQDPAPLNRSEPRRHICPLGPFVSYTPRCQNSTEHALAPFALSHAVSTAMFEALPDPFLAKRPVLAVR